MAEPLKREALERSRAAVKRVMSRYGRNLVVFSVGGGMAQLAFLRWADVYLARSLKLAIEIPIFFVYMTGVVFMLWRMQRGIHAVRLACPQCGAKLEGTSERIAAATGRCDGCGGRVIDEP